MEYEKSSARTDLELRFARKLFPAVMVLQAVLGFFDCVTFKNCHSARSEESAVPGSVKERDSSLRSE